jgi:uncharacterized protein (TIGR02466 family)
MSTPFDLNVRQFWPTTFYHRMWADHVAEAPGIIELCYAIQSREPANIASGVAPSAKSPYGLHESHFDLFAGDHPGLTRLKAFIGQTVQLAAAHANGSKVEPQRLRVAVTDSWFHITNGGGFHDAHYHGGCSWCGIYYLQVGDSDADRGAGAPNGVNRFYSPLGMGGGFKDFGNQYLEFNHVDPPPRDGMLLLFPSYVLHSALPYRGQKDRIVISFNSQVTLA